MKALLLATLLAANVAVACNPGPKEPVEVTPVDSLANDTIVVDTILPND